MLNPLRRLVRRDPIVPMRNDRMATMPPAFEPGLPPDDYVVEGDAAAAQPTTGVRIVHGLQIALIVIMAVLSFAVFWLIGLMLNIL